MPRLLLILFGLLATLRLLPAPAQSPRAGVRAVPVRKQTALAHPDSYAGRQLRVGNGGGFTGFSTTYCLLDNGQLFSRSSRDTAYQFLGRQTTANTKRAFATVETTGRIKRVRFDNPGNMYKFVEWKRGKQRYRVSWGAVGITVPAAYPKFYNWFMTVIPAPTQIK